VNQQREAINNVSATFVNQRFEYVKILGQIYHANRQNISSLNIEDD
jgi:hypothetical protein